MSVPKLILAGLIVLLTGGLAAWSGHPSSAWAASSIKLVPVLSGLDSPVFVTHADDGSNRLFVVEQGGVIKVVQPGSSSPTVFLDIGARMLFGGEQGLLGLAFHPDFPSNKRFFVDYTRQPDGATVIAEYHVSDDANVADPTEKVILTIAQPFANHNGGMLAFGPDRLLYIGMGDGGSANDPGNRAQNVDELLGKILRIDVDPVDPLQPYASPSSNPFFGSTAGRDEIYALGLRNPWRFSFDRGTGTLYAGDVGQGAREEIDIITLGGNYGWRIWEGSLCTGTDVGLCDPAGFIFPITEYGHTLGRCAVTGGYVYRGTQSALPSGMYVYGDFCSGEIFTFDGTTSSVALPTGLSISSFGEDEAGEIYVVNLGGTVSRIAGDSTPCRVTLRRSARSVAARGAAAARVRVMAPPGCGWAASSPDAWITITSGQSGHGNGRVSFSVAPNTSTSPRSGTIAISDQTFTVTQAGASCTASIAPRAQAFPSSGGTGTVVVTIPDGCAWTATSQVGWITVTSGQTGSGDGTVGFSVAPNGGRLFRTGTLTIAGRTFTVTQ